MESVEGGIPAPFTPDLSSNELTVVRKNLEPKHFGIIARILVRPGTPNALPHLEKSTREILARKSEFFKRPGFDKTREVALGNIYYDRGDTEKALMFYKEALKKDYWAIGYRMQAMLGCGLIYEYQGQPARAGEYYRRCCAYYEKQQKKPGRDRDAAWIYRVAREGARRTGK